MTGALIIEMKSPVLALSRWQVFVFEVVTMSSSFLSFFLMVIASSFIFKSF